MKVSPRKDSVSEFLTEEDEEKESVEETEEPSKEPLDVIAEQFPDAPNRQTIETWKSSFGSVNAFVPEGDKLYLLRPLRRLEHKTIAREVRQLANSAIAQEDPAIVEDQLHEKVVTMCMLYPRADASFLSMSPAGLMPTLFNLIMEQSKFLSPERAMSSCYKL